MSSSLNLVPDPVVVAAQAGIFLTNLFVVKKLMLEPYLKLRDARDAQTVGSEGEATELVEKAKSAIEQVEQKMKKTQGEMLQGYEQVRQQTEVQKSKILDEAQTHAKKELQSARERLKQDLAAEKNKLEATVEQLTNQIFTNLTA